MNENPAQLPRPAHRPGLPLSDVGRIVRDLGSLKPKTRDYRAMRRKLAFELGLTEAGIEYHVAQAAKKQKAPDPSTVAGQASTVEDPSAPATDESTGQDGAA